MALLVCLGETPDTVSNTIGRVLLDRAQLVVDDEEARETIVRGVAFSTLHIDELDSPLKEKVWAAVEQAAKQLSSEAPRAGSTWPSGWTEHVGELWREVEARRVDPARPGAWP
jgi:hypothetical protein